MSSFEIQEERRLITEQKKEAVKKGEVSIGSMEEFLSKIKKQLAEHPILKEFITREHTQAKENIKSIHNLYSTLLEENNVGLQAKLSDLITAINKHDDNFTFYANQMLSLTKEKNRRIHKTLDVLDAELKIR